MLLRSQRRKSSTFNLTEVHHDHRSFRRRCSLKSSELGMEEEEEVVDKEFGRDIMMLLDNEKVMSLKEKFENAEDGLNEVEFIHVMKTFLTTGIEEEQERENRIARDVDYTKRKTSSVSTTSSVEVPSLALFQDDARLVSNLSELFAQIDINGDGSMEWDEFTSFIVETGKSSQQSSDDPTSIQPYRNTFPKWKDTTKHHSLIEKVYSFRHTPFPIIAAIDANSKYLKLYNSSCNPIGRDICVTEHGNVLCAEHIPQMSQLVVGASDLSITFFDDVQLKPVSRFYTPCSQKCLEWASTARVLFSAGVSGVIHAWDLDDDHSSNEFLSSTVAPTVPVGLPMKGRRPFTSSTLNSMGLGRQVANNKPTTVMSNWGGTSDYAESESISMIDPLDASTSRKRPAGIQVANVSEKFRIGGIRSDGRLVPGMHEDMVLSLLEISTLGWLASASMDCTIRLWDVMNGRAVRVLEGHEMGVHSMSYSEESRFMVSAGYDYDALVWNPYVKSLILRLHGHTAPLCNVEVIPETPQIITADVTGVVKVWDSRTFTCMQTFSAGESANSRSTDSKGNGWDIGNADEVRVQKEEGISKISKSLNRSVQRERGSGRKLWEKPPRTQNTSCIGSKDVIRDFCCVLPHKSIVVAGRKLGKFEYEKLKHPELTDDLPVRHACYNHTSFTFITAGLFDVKTWDARTGKQLRRYRDVMGGAEITAMCLDDRERKFILGDEHGNIRVFDYANGTVMKSFEYDENNGKAHTREVSNITYNNRDKTVVSISWDLSILIHDEIDPEEGKLLRAMTGVYDTDIAFLKMSQDLSLIATASTTSPQVHIWDYEFARLEGRVHNGYSDGPGEFRRITSCVTSLAFCHPYPAVLVADGDGYISMWATRGSPAELKYSCLLKFKGDGTAVAQQSSTTQDQVPSEVPPAGTGKVAAVSAMEMKGSHLYTANEAGMMVRWDFTSCFKFLHEKLGMEPISKPVLCENPRRNIRWDASCSKSSKAGHGTSMARLGSSSRLGNSSQGAVAEKEEGDPLFVRLKRAMQEECEGPRQIATSSDIPPPICLSTWEAHNDRIQSLQIIQEPEALLTVSHDQTCKLFSFDGDLLGVLMQGGEPKRVARPKRDESTSTKFSYLPRPIWKFKVDTAKRRKLQLSHAHEVLKELDAKEEGGKLIASNDVQQETRNTKQGCEGVSVASKGTIRTLLNSSRESTTVLRKTPKLAPINRINAGKGLGGTCRGLKLRTAVAKKKNSTNY